MELRERCYVPRIFLAEEQSAFPEGGSAQRRAPEPRPGSPPGAPRSSSAPPPADPRDRARSSWAARSAVMPARTAPRTFSFTPPIGKHVAPQGDFAGHRDVVPHRPTREHRDQRRRHGHTGRWALLRDSTGRNVDVHVAIEHLLLDVQSGRMGAGIGPRRAGRFLHHVTQLAGEHQLALAAHG